MKKYISVVGRVLYFSMPEQAIIYEAMKMYLEVYPENEDAKTIKNDFYRTNFEK